MVIDTSAILAILGNEPEAALFAEKIAAAETCCVSAASLLFRGEDFSQTDLQTA